MSERLLLRLRDDLGLDLPADAIIQRMYPGHGQRSAGAFIWVIGTTDYRHHAFGAAFIGSQERVRDLVRAKSIVVDHCFGDIAICSGDEN